MQEIRSSGATHARLRVSYIQGSTVGVATDLRGSNSRYFPERSEVVYSITVLELLRFHMMVPPVNCCTVV